MSGTAVNWHNHHIENGAHVKTTPLKGRFPAPPLPGSWDARGFTGQRIETSFLGK